MASKTSMNHDEPSSSRVAQAREIHRSIAACNESIARGNDIHALTAALMLPCYQAEFRRLALGLTPVEENDLKSALRMQNTEPAPAPRAAAA